MDMDRLVSEVTRQILQGMQGSQGVGKNPSRILALLCGVPERVEAAIGSLREISSRGHWTGVLMTSSAERTIGRQRIASETGVEPFKADGPGVSAHDLVNQVDAVVVPLLSLTTAAKVAAFTSDNLATCVLVEALGRGRRVVAERDTIDWFTGNPACPQPFKARAMAILDTLSSLGVELVRGGELAARVAGHSMGHPMMQSYQFSSHSQFAQPQAPPPTVPSYGPLPFGPSLQPLSSCANECVMPRGDCAGCGHCAVRKVPTVMAMIDAGAARVGARPGILTPHEQIGAMIDHTLLKPEATEGEVRKLCEEARKHVFASVCVNPAHVELSARLLAGSPVKVCTVIGFPLGSTTTGTKAFETREAIMKGADEIDMVINVGALKAGNYRLVEDDIRAVKQAAGDRIVKVILETALLTDEEKVKACTLCKTAGADFVKTSTGFGPGGATVDDIKLMRKTVGEEMGVKASGGVRDYETAKAMVDAGATRIGASASVKIVSGQGGAGGGY